MGMVLYQVLLWFAYPLVRLRLRLRARREPAYGERIAERFGHVPSAIPKGSVWFHTVSAGETIAAAPLIAALVRDYPGIPFLVTTMTPTGSAEVVARLGTAVHHCYAPYDFPGGVRRFFDRVEPRVLVLMETELWPNIIAAARQRAVPVLLVNARLSARSANGYRRLAGLTRSMLRALEVIACQERAHAERFIALGAQAERVSVTGSMKFDIRLPDDHAEHVARLATRWGTAGVPVWIAGSTHAGEEEQILAAHRLVSSRFPAARLVLVPRHPARAGSVHALCRAAGFATGRHSLAQSADSTAEVVLVDAMGVLFDYYALAQVAFVGGSLVDRGGHNPIEPALVGVPILTGPHVFNFADVVARFRAERCLSEVADVATLAAGVARWFDDPSAGRAAGERARAVVVANQGATTCLRGLLDAVLAQVTADRAGEDNRRPIG